MYDVLEGYRVLEVAIWAFAPSATAVLSDWGADVIKVVHPVNGDPMRSSVIDGLPDREVDVHFLWEICNRGKRSIAMDLANPEARPAFEALVARADVFVTNFLPPARTKLGIDVDHVRAINPHIVYARASGHGAHGPQRDKGGYDHVSFWSRTGMAHAVSHGLGSFVPQPGPALGDLVSGVTLAGGIAGALLRRERTGRTAVVDTSLLSTGAFAFSPSIVASELYGTDGIPRFSHDDQPNPLITAYRTKDDREVYLVGMHTDADFADFCNVIGAPELASDARFATWAGRLEHAAACIAALDAAFARRTLPEWNELLDALKTPWAIVQTSREVHDDSQVTANGYVVEVDSAGGRPYPLVASPVQFDEQPTGLRRAPFDGEHTDEVLSEAGLTADAIDRLRQLGGIR